MLPFLKLFFDFVQDFKDLFDLIKDDDLDLFEEKDQN